MINRSWFYCENNSGSEQEIGSAPSKLSVLGLPLAWTCTGLACTVTISVSLYENQLCWVWRQLSRTYPPILTLRSFMRPLLHRPPEPRKKGFDEDNSSELSSRVSHSALSAQVWVSLLITIYWKRSFSAWELRDAVVSVCVLQYAMTSHVAAVSLAE